METARGADGRLRLGQALLVLSGLIIISTIGALHPSGNGVRALIAVSVVLLAFTVTSPLVPWAKGPPWMAVVFPAAVLGGLAAIGCTDRQAAAAYAGLIVFCFVYVGLTQRPGISLFLLPPAAGTWLTLQGGWSTTIAVRLIIAIAVWTVVGELLSQRIRRESEELIDLQGQALTDPLTGLLNRRGLELPLAAVAGGDTVVMCDLDHFKRVNDVEGHPAGDRVLADFGGLLRAALRGQDLAARYGGEEFLLLLANTTPEAALDVMSRMRLQWALLHPAVSFSSGIALVSAVMPVSRAIAAADEALYASKADGRNCDHIAYQHIVRASH